MFFFLFVSFLFILFFFFFFNDTATTEIYTLSLHDALPIWPPSSAGNCAPTTRWSRSPSSATRGSRPRQAPRSEEHTSELQSRRDLVCRLLLEKKKKGAFVLPPQQKKKQRQ